MRIKLYNHLSRKKELFKPLKKGRAGLYTCGPTVYNFVHIGNLRTYIFEDVLRRTLEYAGYRVRHVMNITDVEDKIIRDAAKAGKDIKEFTAPYEAAFFEDLAKLNIERAWKYPRATEHIPEMVRLTQALLKKGVAYQMDRSVYFAIARFKPYGKLSRVGKRALKAGARVDTDEYTKQDVKDFVLWKGKKAGEPSWPALFGEGRPGWHIECSAMSMKSLGETFDIHAGGIDLLFPHHENEIAQSEGATGKKFARFFIEGEHLLVNNEKMSKSLGNVFSLRDIEMRGFSPLALRYLVLTSHYRSKLNFTWESLSGAQRSMQKLYDFVRMARETVAQENQKSKIRNQKTQTKLKNHTKELDTYKMQFEKMIADDLNTPKALTVVWKVTHEYHKQPSRYDAEEILTFLYDVDRILGLRLKEVKAEAIPEHILKFAENREKYRQLKDWAKADEMRKKIKAAGYAVEDAPEGSKVKKI